MFADLAQNKICIFLKQNILGYLIMEDFGFCRLRRIQRDFIVGGYNFLFGLWSYHLSFEIMLKLIMAGLEKQNMLLCWRLVYIEISDSNYTPSFLFLIQDAGNCCRGLLIAGNAEALW